MGVRLQPGGVAAGGGRAAESDDRRGCDGVQLGVGGAQQPAVAPLPLKPGRSPREMLRASQGAGSATPRGRRLLVGTAGSALARRDCGVRLLIGTARAAPAQTARPALVGTARPAPAPPREPVPLIRPSPLGRSTDGGARPTLSSVNTPCAGYPAPVDTNSYLMFLLIGALLVVIDGQVIYLSGRKMLRQSASDAGSAESQTKLVVVLFHLVSFGVLALASTIGEWNTLTGVVARLGLLLLFLAVAHWAATTA